MTSEPSRPPAAPATPATSVTPAAPVISGTPAAPTALALPTAAAWGAADTSGAPVLQQAWKARALRILADVGVPTAVFYALRALGLGVYPTLVLTAVVPAVVAVVRLLRSGKVGGLGLYLMSVMLVSTTVSLIDGSPRFLLARGAWLSGITGLLLIASVRTARPLAFQYARPLMEHRTRVIAVPGDWDELWDRLPKFRRVWRIGSVLWGISLLGDSAARVVMAYTLPPNLVPALGTVLYAVTALVLLLISHAYFLVSGLYDRRSLLYAPLAVQWEAVG